MIWKIFSVSIKEICSEGKVDKRLASLEEKRKEIDTWQWGNKLDMYRHHKCEEKQISLKNFSEQSLYSKRVLGTL